jgi:hypothetical protein
MQTGTRTIWRENDGITTVATRAGRNEIPRDDNDFSGIMKKCDSTLSFKVLRGNDQVSQ